jgi:hypothetical protein
MSVLRSAAALTAVLIGASSPVEAASKPKSPCEPFRIGLVPFAAVVLVGEVIAVAPSKVGPTVEVRPREFLRGGPADRVRFVDRTPLTTCSPEAVRVGDVYFLALFEDPALGLVTVLRYPHEKALLVGPAVFPFRDESIHGLGDKGPVPLAAVREKLAAAEPLVRYEPATPTSEDVVYAVVLRPSPGPGCPSIGAARRSGRKVLTTSRLARPGMTCEPVGDVELRIRLGRLPAGRYVHFHDGRWVGYLTVLP